MTPGFLFLRKLLHGLCGEVVELSLYDGSWSSWLGDPMSQWGRGEPQFWMLIWQCDLPIRDVAWFVPLFGDMGCLSISFGIGIRLGILG